MSANSTTPTYVFLYHDNTYLKMKGPPIHRIGGPVDSSVTHISIPAGNCVVEHAFKLRLALLAVDDA